MKRQPHTEKQIIQILNEAKAGAAIEELCRRHGISQTIYYKWNQKFGALQVSDTRRFRLLEDENRNISEIHPARDRSSKATASVPKTRLQTVLKNEMAKLLLRAVLLHARR